MDPERVWETGPQTPLWGPGLSAFGLCVCWAVTMYCQFCQVVASVYLESALFPCPWHYPQLYHLLSKFGLYCFNKPATLRYQRNLAHSFLLRTSWTSLAYLRRTLTGPPRWHHQAPAAQALHTLRLCPAALQLHRGSPTHHTALLGTVLKAHPSVLGTFCQTWNMF